MPHIGPEMSSEAPLEEEPCAVAWVESRLGGGGGEGPVAEAPSLVVSAVTVNAAAGEVKNSATDCVDEVERSAIHVRSGGQGELQCEVSVGGSAGQGVMRLSAPGTEPVLEENDSALEVRGFTPTTL